RYYGDDRRVVRVQDRRRRVCRDRDVRTGAIVGFAVAAPIGDLFDHAGSGAVGARARQRASACRQHGEAEATDGKGRHEDEDVTQSNLPSLHWPVFVARLVWLWPSIV